jgi:hypothetical protein
LRWWQVQKNKGNNQSLRPSGFAGAFGRAVAPLGLAGRWAEAQLNPKGKGKAKGNAKAKAKSERNSNAE